MNLDTDRAYAEKFAKDHLVELVTELLKWQDTGVLAEESELRKLSRLCYYASGAAMRTAESLVQRAALEKVFDDAFNSPEIQAKRQQFLREFYSEDAIGGHT